MGTFLEEIQKHFSTLSLPTFFEFLKIPNLSPCFDPDWMKNGFLDKSVDLFVQAAQSIDLKNVSIQKIEQSENKAPSILVVVQGNQCDKSILVYGHMDKTPIDEEWTDGRSPYDPQIDDETKKLFARGSAFGGWSFFVILALIKSMQKFNMKTPKFCLYYDAEEETGSPNLFSQLMKIKAEIVEKPDYVFCFDSGCFDYENLYITTTMKGLVSFDLKVQTLTKGVHSGLGSGIIADNFRILMDLLNQLESVTSGEITNYSIPQDIPSSIYQQLCDFCKAKDMDWGFPLEEGVEEVQKNKL